MRSTAHGRASKSSNRLDDEGNDGLALLQVGLGLDVGAVLLQCPIGHLSQTNEGEGPRQCDIGADGVEDPSEDFERVVGATSDAEEATTGSLAAGIALLGAHAGELEVNSEVEELGDGPAGNSDLVQTVSRCGVQRMAQEVTNEGGEGPVVRGVLEDVEQRHGGAAELVDEEGLQLALDEVSDEEADPQLLVLSQRESGGWVHERWAHGVEQHHGDWSGVFNDEHSSVSDLRSKILVLNLLAVLNAKIGEGLSITTKSNSLAAVCGLQLEALAMNRHVRLVGLLQIGECGTTGELDGVLLRLLATRYNDNFHSFCVNGYKRRRITRVRSRALNTL